MRTGLNFGFLQRLMTTPGLVDEYMLRLEQCHLDTVRVPLHWRRLVDDRGVSIGRGEVGDNYDRFFELLPADLRVLGLIVAPPRSVAVRHFRGVESVTDPYVRFLRAVVDRFERVDEIELWNEPNASDFYLSVADGSSHRPWTSDEFVDQVVLPGVELLHSHRPDMPLCLATFAENGLVGHDYLPGAPSGVLPRNARFEAMRDAEEGDRGRWHFVPSFGPRAIERIAAEVEVRPGDAIALHPYPYFEPGQDQTYAGRTLQLIDDAAEYLAPMRDKGVELWLTEVGCRAHDPRASNRKKLGDQASFVDRVFDAVPSLGVDRVYWYKFDDAPADLVQEKTFGLFDHFGRPRPSYRSFRSLSRSQVEGGPRTVVVT
ncbi:MAG: hypothetical protein IH940_05295, partial [Acidobacteria bacterium]|nr:hypothetical protein [Acidobacteriota bacterium]